MNSKYKVTDMEILREDVNLYTIINRENCEEYLCLTKRRYNGKIHIISDYYRKQHKCGIYPYYHDYDIAEALFVYSHLMYYLLPEFLITPNMERILEGGKCIYKSDEEYKRFYQEEEKLVLKRNDQKIKLKNVFK